MALTGVRAVKRPGADKPKKEASGSAAANRDLNNRIEDLKNTVAIYSDFVEQFDEILNKDRDDIQETAKELDIKFKKNSADRDLLSAIFKKMFEQMFE